MSEQQQQQQKQKHAVDKKKRKTPTPEETLLTLTPCEYQQRFPSYKQEWDLYRRSLPPHVDINDLAWLDSQHLLAVTNTGQLIAWKVHLHLNSNSSSSSAVSFSNKNNKLPWFQHQLSPSRRPLSSIQVANSSTLFVAGNEGLWVLSWSELRRQQPVHITSDEQQQQKHNTITKPRIATPFLHLKLLQSTEGQKTTWTLLLGLTHDQLVCFAYRYKENQLDTLKAVDLWSSSPSPSPSSSTNIRRRRRQKLYATCLAVSETTVLIGTNSNQLLHWTLQQEQQDKPSSNTPTVVVERNAPLVLDQGGEGNTVITAVACCHGQWWTIAGYTSPIGDNNWNHGSGWITTWHGPSRSNVSQCSFQESIQALTVFDARDDSLSRLYAGANHANVIIWESPLALLPSASSKTTTTTTTQQSLSSTKTLAVRPITASSIPLLVAAAGVGSQVNLLQDHSCTATLQMGQGDC